MGFGVPIRFLYDGVRIITILKGSKFASVICCCGLQICLEFFQELEVDLDITVVGFELHE